MSPITNSSPGTSSGSYGPLVAQATAMLKARQVSQASAYQSQGGDYQPTQQPQRPQQQQDTMSALGSQGGANSMDALMAQHQSDMADFQQRAQAMMADNPEGSADFRHFWEFQDQNGAS